MNDIIYFDDILEKASYRRKEMAMALEILDKTGELSEQHIAYALKFMTTEQIRYIMSSIKMLLRTELKA